MLTYTIQVNFLPVHNFEYLGTSSSTIRSIIPIFSLFNGSNKRRHDEKVGLKDIARSLGNSRTPYSRARGRDIYDISVVRGSDDLVEDCYHSSRGFYKLGWFACFRIF